MNTETKAEKVCAFCDKKQSEVAQLIARNETVVICDECIGVSVEILLKHLRWRRVSSKDDVESRLGTLRMEVKLLRQGKGWAEERAEKVEREFGAARIEAEKMGLVRKWWSDHVRETWGEPDGSDSGHIHTSREGTVVIQELVGVLKARGKPDESESE